MPTIKAVAPTADNADKTLPDPSATARLVLFTLIVTALGLAALMNWQGWTGKPFTPATNTTANFALFAGFYVAAQVIERLMQLVSPLVPNLTTFTNKDTDATKAAQTKADRAPVVLGIAALFGVARNRCYFIYLRRQSDPVPHGAAVCRLGNSIATQEAGHRRDATQ